MSGRTARRFGGFAEGKAGAVSLPESVFTDLIPSMDDLDELKLVLLVLWRLTRMQADVAPWITLPELQTDPVVSSALPLQGDASPLAALLARAVEHGILLRADLRLADGTVESRYFANSPRGRAAVAASQRGSALERRLDTAPPNIFALYEENIGSLTALLSEELMEAERTYPATWITEAFAEAVRLNKRNWKYIRAILERWRLEGKDEVDRGDRASDWRRLIEG